MHALWLVLFGCGGSEDGATSGASDSALGPSEQECLLFRSPSLYEDGLVLDAGRCGVLDLSDVRVVGQGDFSVALSSDGYQILPAVTTDDENAQFVALHVSGRAALDGDDGLVWRRMGFHSGAPAGLAPLGPLAFDANGLPAVGMHGTDTPETDGTSWWSGVLGRPDGAALFVGAQSGAVSSFYVAADDDANVHLVWTTGGAPWELPVGEQVVLDPVMIGMGPDASELAASWAASVVERPIIALPPLVDDALPPGWVVDADGSELSQALLEARVAELNNVAVETVWLPEGWEAAVGDWRAHDGFDGGTLGALDAIQTAGFQGGLTLSPLMAAETSTTFVDNPGWWLRDADGEVLLVDGHALVDLTQTGAVVRLQEAIGALVAEGWSAFDFRGLFAMAHPDIRLDEDAVAEPTYTAQGRLNSALAFLASTIPDGVTWIASDVPPLPALGRIGSLGLDRSVQGNADPLADLALRANVAAVWAATRGHWWAIDAGPIPSAGLPLRDHTGQVALLTATASHWRFAGSPVGESTSSPSLLAIDALRETASEATAARFLLSDQGPLFWAVDNGPQVLLNSGSIPAEVQSPGGDELLTGESSDAGSRTLLPGDGEVWR